MKVLHTTRTAQGFSKKFRSILRSSEVLAGLVILLGICALLTLWQPLAKVDPESLPAAHTWVWWATKEYLNEPHAPDVVLLGSSLLMHPVSLLDANYLGVDFDYVHHHRSVYMEQALARTPGLSNPICFNFALPGGMVSDDYIVARALFRNTHKPKVMVLGLTLRDFIDNGVHCAGATPAFRYLKRFTNIDDLVDLAMPQFFQRFEYVFGNALYLWEKKLDLQVVLGQATSQLLEPVSHKLFPDSRLNEVDSARNLPSNLRSEIEEGVFIVKSQPSPSFVDNTAEYRKRFCSPNQSLFAIQNTFLEKLLALAQRENIQVVIVNMPLTPGNHALMPPGSYQQYLKVVQAAARRWDCPFVELDANGNFHNTDFYDTAHMNSSGGKKLIDATIATMLHNKAICTSLKVAKQSVASRRQAL